MEIFDERCKCGGKMDTIHENGRDTKGTEYIYWCPYCGSIFEWYDRSSLESGVWKHPVNNS